MPTHAEKRILPYTQQQLYDLVADVGRYPEFLPWCLAARVRERSDSHIRADLIIGYKVVRERFTSNVTLDPANFRIDVSYAEGPFKYLNNHWIFRPVPEAPGQAELDFYVDFEFHNRMLQKIIETLFNEAVKRMVSAFESRAKALYG